MDLQLRYKYINESLNSFLLRMYGDVDSLYHFISTNNMVDLSDFYNNESFYIDLDYISPVFVFNNSVEILKIRNSPRGKKEFGQSLNDILISEYLNIDYLYEFIVENNITNLKDVKLHKTGTIYNIKTITSEKHFNPDFKISSGLKPIRRAFSKQFAKQFA